MSQYRYHVNPASGDANVCHAEVRCPFGGEEVHFASPEEARDNYERTMAADTLASFKKPVFAPEHEALEKGLEVPAGFSKELIYRREAGRDRPFLKLSNANGVEISLELVGPSSDGFSVRGDIAYPTVNGIKTNSRYPAHPNENRKNFQVYDNESKAFITPKFYDRLAKELKKTVEEDIPRAQKLEKTWRPFPEFKKSDKGLNITHTAAAELAAGKTIAAYYSPINPDRPGDQARVLMSKNKPEIKGTRAFKGTKAQKEFFGVKELWLVYG